MRRDVSEVQIGRKPAGRVVVGMVAILGVAVEAAFEEPPQHALGGVHPAVEGGGADAVVDGQPGQRRRRRLQQFFRGGRPAAGHIVGQPVEERQTATGKGIRLRRVFQVRRQLPLQEPAEVECPRERLRRRPQGQQPVRINRLQLDRQPVGGGLHHLRQKEAGVIIGDNDGGPLPQPRQQALAVAGLGLDIGVVGRRRAGEGVAVVGHPLQDEAVQPVTRPAIAATERLKDQQRPLEPFTPLRGPVQAEVVPRAAEGDHPVEHVLAALPRRAVVQSADANFRDARRHGPAKSVRNVVWSNGPAVL